MRADLHFSPAVGKAGGRRAAPLALAAAAALGLVAAGTLAVRGPVAGEPPATAPAATAPAAAPAPTPPATAAAATQPVPTGKAMPAALKRPPVGAPAAPTRSVAMPQASPAPAAPALSFTDDDLDKYHKPQPTDEEMGEEPESGATGGAPGPATGPALPGSTAPASTGPAGGIGKNLTRPRPPASPAGSIPEHVPLVRTPMNIAAPPGADPLKESRDREAKEKFRAGQLQALRDRIAPLQARLDYLNTRRAALLNPLQIPPAPQSDDDRNRESSLKPKDLLDQIDAEIASVQSELKSAQDDLVSLETRFGGAQ